MDDYDFQLVNHFCHRMDSINHVMGEMRSFYIFEDKRPGSPVDRINQDSLDFATYERMFKP